MDSIHLLSLLLTKIWHAVDMVKIELFCSDHMKVWDFEWHGKSSNASISYSHKV